MTRTTVIRHWDKVRVIVNLLVNLSYMQTNEWPLGQQELTKHVQCISY